MRIFISIMSGLLLWTGAAEAQRPVRAAAALVSEAKRDPARYFPELRGLRAMQAGVAIGNSTVRPSGYPAGVTITTGNTTRVFLDRKEPGAPTNLNLTRKSFKNGRELRIERGRLTRQNESVLSWDPRTVQKRGAKGQWGKAQPVVDQGGRD